MKKIIKRCLVTAMILTAQMFAQYAVAEDLELFIALRLRYDGDEDKMIYAKPAENKISVYQRPIPFYVVVENKANRAKKLWESGKRNGRSNFSIEVENSKGQKTKIKKKETPSMTRLRTYDMIRPGEQRVEKVLIDPDSWEGFRKAEDALGNNFKVRAIYRNENETIYSPWYEVTVGRGGSSSLAGKEEKEQRKYGVLSSVGKH